MTTVVEKAIYEMEFVTGSAAQRLSAVSGAMNSLVSAAAGVETSQDKITKATRRSEESLGRFISKHDPATRALREYARELENLTSFERDGIGSKQGLGLALDRVTEKYKRNMEAADASANAEKRRLEAAKASMIAEGNQANFSRFMGVDREPATRRGATTSALETEFKNMEKIAEEKAKHVAEVAQRSFNEQLRVGAPSAAGSGATYSALEAEFTRMEKIAEARAEAAANHAQFAFNRFMGVGAAPGRSAASSAAVFQESFREQEEFAKKLDEVKRKIDPVAHSWANYRKELHEASAVAVQGGASLDDLAKLHTNMGRQQELSIRGLTQANVAMDKYTKGVGFARHEVVNLGRQFQDVFVSLGSGQNPLIVLLQQGSQIADVFATSEASIGSFFRQLGSWAARFLFSPAGIITGLTAAGAAAGYFAYSLASSLHELEGALQGIGRGSGQTVASLNRIAEAAARTSLTTRAQARESAGIFAATGRIGPDVLPGVFGQSRAYGLITGQSETEASKELAKAFADPARGAETLNEKLGFLNAALRDYIRNAVASGNLGAAQKALLEGINPALVDAEKRLTKFDRLWQNIKKSASEAAEAIARGVMGPDIEEQLQILEQNRGRFNFRGRSTADFDAEADAIRRTRAAQSRQAMEQRLQAEADRLGTRGNDAIRRIIEDVGRLESLRTDKSLLETLIGSPAAMKELGLAASDAAEAQRRVNNMLEHYATAAQRATKEGQLEVDAIIARTLAEKTLIAQTQVWLQVMRDTGNSALAAAEAERVRLKAVADGIKQAQDALRDSTSSAAIARLETPLERAIAEIRARAERTWTPVTGPAPRLDPGTLTPPARATPAPQSSVPGKFDRGRFGVPDVSQTEALEEFERARRRNNSAAGTAEDKAIAALGNAMRAYNESRTNGPPVQGATRSYPTTGPGSSRAIAAQSTQIDIGAEIEKVTTIRIKELNKALDDQIVAEDARRRAVLLSSGAAAELNERQKLLTEFTRAGAFSADVNAEAQKRLREEIEALAKRTGEAAQRQYQFNESVRQFETVRGAFHEGVSGGLSDLYKRLRDGENGWSALGNAAVSALDRINTRLLDMISSNVADVLFGNNRGGGTGIFGGLIGQLFGLGGNNFAATGAPFSFGAGGYTGAGPFLTSSRGNMFAQGNVIPFRRGGIVSRKSHFEMANGGIGSIAEDQPEGILPLGRNGRGEMGVKVVGGGGGGTPVSLKHETHYHNAPPNMRTEESNDGRGNTRLDVFFDKQNAAAIAKPGSATQRAQRATFGASPTLTRY